MLVEFQVPKKHTPLAIILLRNDVMVLLSELVSDAVRLEKLEVELSVRLVFLWEVVFLVATADRLEFGSVSWL